MLFLTIGPEDEPSSRFRVYQYLESLERAGVEVRVRPRVGRAYFEMGYGLRRLPTPLRAGWAAGSFAWRTLGRLRDLAAARHYDVVVVQKETFPFGMERLVSALGLRVLYDFDDAVYARPRAGDGLGRGVRGAAERLLRRERALAALLPRCRGVLAGSPVLASWARAHSRHVEVLPSVVDTDAYPVRPVRRSGRPTVGWVGAPANVLYLEPLRPVFQELARRCDFRLVLRGPARFDCPDVDVELRPWRRYDSRAEEADDLAGIDVGIMPLSNDEFAAGKCAFKAIQYMASGIPVVASPVGASADVVQHGRTGLHARTPEEWLAHLERLLTDPDLRERLGRAGRTRAERHYSLSANLPRLLSALESAAGR